MFFDNIVIAVVIVEIVKENGLHLAKT